MSTATKTRARKRSKAIEAVADALAAKRESQHRFKPGDRVEGFLGGMKTWKPGTVVEYRHGFGKEYCYVHLDEDHPDAKIGFFDKPEELRPLLAATGSSSLFAFGDREEEPVKPLHEAYAAEVRWRSASTATLAGLIAPAAIENLATRGVKTLGEFYDRMSRGDALGFSNRSTRRIMAEIRTRKRTPSPPAPLPLGGEGRSDWSPGERKKAGAVWYVNPRELSLHPRYELVPAMRPAEYAEFAADVKERGVKVPIELQPDTKTVLDGRCRRQAAIDAGLEEVPVRNAQCRTEDPVVYMLRAASQRRHLTDDQRAMLAQAENDYLAEQGRGRQHAQADRGQEGGRGRKKTPEARPTPGVSEATEHGPRTLDSAKPRARAAAAQSHGVSEHKVRQAAEVARAAPELAEKVKRGELPLRKAAQEARQKRAERRFKDGDRIEAAMYEGTAQRWQPGTVLGYRTHNGVELCYFRLDGRPNTQQIGYLDTPANLRPLRLRAAQANGRPSPAKAAAPDPKALKRLAGQIEMKAVRLRNQASLVVKDPSPGRNLTALKNTAGEMAELLGHLRDLPPRPVDRPPPDRAWETDVRDPAEAAAGRWKTLAVDGARAKFRLAELPDGRWAVQWNLQYSTGTMGGSGVPWKPFPTREAAIDVFRQAAMRHFGPDYLKKHHGEVSARQERAQRLIYKRLVAGWGVAPLRKEAARA